MKLGNITKRLRREAAANPKKAAILGILFVVSLYFWVPLVGGWLGGEETSTAAAPQSATAVAGPSSSAPSVAEKAENRHSWRQIDRWRREDPRTTTSRQVVRTRDPFEFPKSEIAKTESAETTNPSNRIVTPEDAGLSLSSTIIGPRSRMARINGKTYTIGQSIETTNEEAALKAVFKLTEVNPDGVVLESDSGRFELTLPDPRKSGKIEIHRHSP
ncbi:MAG: hypothetical protein JW959_13450 [Pirellulales bacterium]|nr:hypothetical protein [Pirellulales bacterium]